MIRGVLVTVVTAALVAPTVAPVQAAEAVAGDPPPAADVADPERDAREAAEERARAAAEEAAQALRDRLRAEREAARALTSAREAVSAAVGRLADAKVAGQRADGVVRSREEALPPLLLAARELEDELTTVERDLAAARRRQEAARAELEVATAALAERALRTFKTGRSSELTAPLAAIREARDPGQLVRSLADLRAVTRDGARTVRAVERELAELATTIVAAEGARVELEAELAEVVAATEVAEGDAATARDEAAAREAVVVAALAAEVSARRAVTRAERRLADAVEATEDAARAAREADVEVEVAASTPGDGTAEVDGTVEADEVLEQREAEAAARRRAHDRARRLPASARRATDAWVCPVEEASFVNDWAFPRSGGRRHEGTDVFAPLGAPIAAVAPGTVTVLDRTDGPGDLGGITVTIAAGPSRQYYAHLRSIAPELELGQVVEAGDVVGYVGTTGNARGTPPHLHLGWYVDDVAVNPYASLAVACADQGWRLPTPARTAR